MPHSKIQYFRTLQITLVGEQRFQRKVPSMFYVAFILTTGELRNNV